MDVKRSSEFLMEHQEDYMFSNIDNKNKMETE
jgi:hypothetical protein